MALYMEIIGIYFNKKFKRCSLAGCDLNRRWDTPKKDIHPEIYYSRNLILEFN